MTNIPLPKMKGLASEAPDSKANVALAAAVLTVLACLTGGALGFQLVQSVRTEVADRSRPQASQPGAPALRYSGDMVIQYLKPVVANLAAPANVWVRIEGAVVFKNGALPNPEVAAAQIQEDILTYARTLNLSQLEGPSALQNIREDLNERAQLRLGGKLSEVIIQTLVVQ